MTTLAIQTGSQPNATQAIRKDQSVQEDGFVQARGQRRGTQMMNRPVINLTGEANGGANRTSQEIPQIQGSANIALSNKYGSLEMDTDLSVSQEDMVSGPDGFQPVFYQDSWEIVGESVTRCGLEFFQTGVLATGMNDAMLVLIPKLLKPERIMQFRPISLCNVLFKTITKAMMLRLKKLMPNLIGPAQASFIPGRLSADNIVVVQEAVHSMRRKQGRRGWMLLKLDLEKAYDRLRWDFLEDTLRAAKLPEMWIQWIMQCVMNLRMSLLWNGEKTEAFRPQRGLRQGDPLSSYLFVLCMERSLSLTY
ncbi:Reverse transcriptase domain-containing protein [Hirschfeldia incana]|nr:Reverse transcriptase domain-containing protein [Hirschfeldia incana]